MSHKFKRCFSRGVISAKTPLGAWCSRRNCCKIHRMPPQEVSVFLLARQLIRPNILVLDARAPGDYLKGTRLKAAIPYYDGLLDTEVGLTHYERVIGYGQLATQVVELFQASHHNIFTGDLDAFAKEFPEHCWCSMSEEELAEALSQPATLVVDTRREGFERGLRLKNAVNFIPNVGFTGWCRRVVNEPWYRNVVCYGMVCPRVMHFHVINRSPTICSWLFSWFFMH